MSISCMGRPRLEYSSGRVAETPAVTPGSLTAVEGRAPAMARRSRVARGDLAERGGPPDLPSDGCAVPDGAHSELRRRGGPRPGARRGDEARLVELAQDESFLLAV